MSDEKPTLGRAIEAADRAFDKAVDVERKVIAFEDKARALMAKNDDLLAENERLRGELAGAVRKRDNALEAECKLARLVATERAARERAERERDEVLGQVIGWRVRYARLEAALLALRNKLTGPSGTNHHLSHERQLTAIIDAALSPPPATPAEAHEATTERLEAALDQLLQEHHGHCDECSADAPCAWSVPMYTLLQRRALAPATAAGGGLGTGSLEYSSANVPPGHLDSPVSCPACYDVGFYVGGDNEQHPCPRCVRKPAAIPAPAPVTGLIDPDCPHCEGTGIVPRIGQCVCVQSPAASVASPGGGDCGCREGALCPHHAAEEG